MELPQGGHRPSAGRDARARAVAPSRRSAPSALVRRPCWPSRARPPHGWDRGQCPLSRACPSTGGVFRKSQSIVG
eukprot:6791195-Pyramimonas_sp.AAC.1